MLKAGKILRIAVFAFIVVLGSSSWTKANDKFVFCVQRELNLLGFDVGASDGVIGPRTVAALKKLAQSKSSLATISPLDYSSAPLWCDGLASTFPAVSYNADVARNIAFEFGPGVTAFEMRAVIGGSFYAFELYADLFDFALDYPVTVRFGKDREWQLDQYVELRGIPLADRGRHASAFWASRESIDGQVFANNILITRLRDDFLKGDPQGVMELGAAALLSHELFHTVQDHLIGDKEFARNDASAVGQVHTGPAWLSEGLAELLKKTAMSRLSSLTKSELLKNADEYSLNWRSQEEPYLSELEAGDITDAHYLLGSIAAERLIKLAGEEAFPKYWREIGGGSNWIQAFEGAYGITLDSFYDDFNASIGRSDDPRRMRRVIVLDGPSAKGVANPVAAESNKAAAQSGESTLTDADAPPIPPDGSADVLCVQVVLKELGYPIETMSGRIDSVTQRAVVDYIKEHRQASGEVPLEENTASIWCSYLHTHEELTGRANNIAEMAIKNREVLIDIATEPDALKAVLFLNSDRKPIVEVTAFLRDERDGTPVTRASVPYSGIGAAEYICFALAQGWRLLDTSGGGAGGKCLRLRPGMLEQQGFIFTMLDVVPNSG